MKSHLSEMNDTWFSHFKIAMSLALYSLVAFFVLAVHAFVPGIFPTTGSQIFKKIQTVLNARGAL